MTESLTTTLLVTGANGFIGKRLVPALEQGGMTVYSCSASSGQDICNPAALSAFKDKGISQVIHLAGKTFVPDSWVTPDRFYEVNTLGTQHVLDFCRATGARLVYVSAYVYGIPQYLPISELHRVAPNNPYAHSKWLAEELCRFYAQHLGVAVTVLRPFNLFGPGQSGQFLIPTILKQAGTEAVIMVKDATPKRDYLHIDDFVRACIKSLRVTSRFSLFNVGSGHSVSVAELLDMVTRHASRPLTWQSTEQQRVNEIPDTIADISAIQAALQWRPEISLEDYVKAELA